MKNEVNPHARYPARRSTLCFAGEDDDGRQFSMEIYPRILGSPWLLTPAFRTSFNL